MHGVAAWTRTAPWDTKGHMLLLVSNAGSCTGGLPVLLLQAEARESLRGLDLPDLGAGAVRGYADASA